MDLVLTGTLVQCLRRNVGVVGPDDRVALGIHAQLGEESRVMERLEYSAVLQQVGKVDIADNPILEADTDYVAAE